MYTHVISRSLFSADSIRRFKTARAAMNAVCSCLSTTIVFCAAATFVPPHAMAQNVPSNCSPVGSTDCTAPFATPFIYNPVACNVTGDFSSDIEASNAIYSADWATTGHCDLSAGAGVWDQSGVTAGDCSSPPFSPYSTFGFLISGWYSQLYNYGNPIGSGCSVQPSFTNVTAYRSRTLACPPGYLNYGDHCEDQGIGTFDQGKTLGKMCPSCGNPIISGNGNKYQEESDYRGTEDMLLEFRRYYNSRFRRPDVNLDTLHSFWKYESVIGHQARGRLAVVADADVGLKNIAFDAVGGGWRHTYQRSLRLVTSSVISTAFAYRPDGKVYVFTLYNSAYYAQKDVDDRLITVSDGSAAF